MNKLTVNEELILSEARARLADAEQEERDAAVGLRLASAIVSVHRANLEAAEKLLTPKPPKKAENAPASVAAPLPPSPKDLTAPCSKAGCDELAASPVHDPNGGYAGYHPFEPPKSVALAPRKLKPKPEIAKNAAIGVGASAGD